MKDSDSKYSFKNIWPAGVYTEFVCRKWKAASLSLMQSANFARVGKTVVSIGKGT